MKCDYCGKQLTLGNTAGYAPHGLPLYVCKDCYKELSKTVVEETSEDTSVVKKTSEISSERVNDEKD